MVNELKVDDFFTDWDAKNGFELGWPQPGIDHLTNFGDSPNGSAHVSPNGSALVSPDASATSSNGNVSSSTSFEGDDVYADSEIFSDIVLGYINRMLNEENIDEKLDIFQGHPELEATEKPFYEILGEKYPPPSDQPSMYNNPSPETPDSNIYVKSSSSNSINNVVASGNWAFGAIELPQNYLIPVDYSSQSSFGSTSSVHNATEGLGEPTMTNIEALDQFSESMLAEQFMRGVEEARKFLPKEDKLVINLEDNGVSLPPKLMYDYGLDEVKEEEKEYTAYGSRGRKNRHSDELDLEEGRSNKQSAVDYTEETLRSEMSDLVLLCPNCDGKEGVSSKTWTQNEATRSPQNGHTRGSGSSKSRGKKPSKTEVVDLRTLLIHCAQTVAIDDRRSANDLLKQIRQHASPFGDGTQRLAHYFADGLEARLAGMGSEKYHSFVAKPVSATDILKAYGLYMSACPFKKVSFYFSTQMILDTTEKASKIHIVDFGIYFGFQWPSFLQRLSKRPGGPPKLRITGIDLPQPGFRPAERIEQTGRRIAEYARSFNVPFEYQGIAAKFETIKIEDLRIAEDEMVVVNCSFSLKNLADETVAVDCPRTRVLSMIRKLNPALFTLAVVNGSYNAPFFVTRFREALFHFSALFDMLEMNTPREDEQRLLIEQNIFGRDAMNVIACEGTERVERPETYKQWQVRNFRAGFTQLPLDRDIVKKSKCKVKELYHKDFVVDEDGRWLLLGWKGRIIYALSAWKPNSR